MNPLYVSAFAVNFSDYALLERWIRTAPVEGIGVELGTSWKTADFYDILEANLHRFQDVPVTLHAPFTETCTQPDSDEEARMWQLYDRAFDLYHRTGAASMVVHTHQGSFADDEADWARERSLEVLLQLAQRAGEEGVSLTVENVGFPGKNNSLFDLPQFIELFQALPRWVGCLIDTGHAILNGWDIPHLICRLGTRIHGYHLNTNDGLKDRHFPIFSTESALSTAEMQKILQTIHTVTPDAHIVLEYSPSCGVTEQIIHDDLLLCK